MFYHPAEKKIFFTALVLALINIALLVGAWALSPAQRGKGVSSVETGPSAERHGPSSKSLVRLSNSEIKTYRLVHTKAVGLFAIFVSVLSEAFVNSSGTISYTGSQFASENTTFGVLNTQAGLKFDEFL